MLFSFLNISSKTERRIVTRKAQSVHMSQKKYEAVKEEKLKRYMGTLDIKEDVSDVLTESVEAVCETKKKTSSMR